MKNETIRTALISVTDKTNLDKIATVLREHDIKILSSSGTKKYLADKGIEAEEIAAYTGSPEILGGRVKTLHPKIHAGILADRSKPDHMSQLEEQAILPIDLVITNLYRFREKYNEGDKSAEELCEFIDIGGVTLIRAAAKNFHHVTVVTDPADYERVAGEIRESGGTTLATRRRLARDAFGVTSQYDATIEAFAAETTEVDKMPARLNLGLEKVKELRYGENPHQTAALYRGNADSPIFALEQRQGKELSFNNYLDLIAAFGLARDMGGKSVAVIKHTNPCGAAWCDGLLASFRRALATDRTSAFGGIVALNGVVDKEVADELNQLFLEVVVARSFDGDALAAFKKKKNLRVITIPDRYWDAPSSGHFGVHVEGIFLVQDADVGFPELEEIEIASVRRPSDEELQTCRMAWKVAKHVKSNAIVIADAQGTVGIGAGQMSRVDSSQIATRKAFDAKLSLMGAVAASDAFFPFADGVTALAKAGISAVIQPGGSIRDREVVEAADTAKISMLLTGRRHFRHV